MIKYEIEGGHLPVVICYPDSGETLCSESGAMSWMSANMKMNTNSGGGVKKVFSRMFSGESFFMNEFTAEGGAGMIAAYPLYRRMSRQAKEKYAPRILELSAELTGENAE